MRTSPRKLEKVELLLTPMIDVVFQLLAFFLLTLRIVPEEGDFALHLPPAGSAQAVAAAELPTLRVRLLADSRGELASVQLNGERLAGAAPLAELHRRAVAYWADVPPSPRARPPAVDLVCDPGLKYEHALRAIAALSGERRGARIAPLFERIHFSPPR